jgi:nicotinate-nucleotide pyrophosphorylase (carboxylating)
MDKITKIRLHDALKEDHAWDDITSKSLIPETLHGSAKIVSRAEGVLCGVEIAEECFKLVDESIIFKVGIKDGERVKAGSIIARVKGLMRGLLAAERLALNLLSHLSGISTLTSKFVEKVRPYGTRIYDTRKTTPLWRSQEKYAVRMGGGYNHRMDLAGACFVKDNHIDASGGLSQALERLFGAKKPPDQIIVETRNIDEVKIASSYPVDIILLDNMSVSMLKVIAGSFEGKFEFEISGGVTLDTVEKYAETGIGRISIGALTHSAKALDIALDYE